MSTTITAEFKNGKTKFNVKHRKEDKCIFESYSALVPYTDIYGKPALKAVVELKLYNTGSYNTAAIWVHETGIQTSGTGKASGHGYHRPSAAAAEAIANASIELSEDISGRGDQSIKEAVMAIAIMTGNPDAMIYHCHQ